MILCGFVELKFEKYPATSSITALQQSDLVFVRKKVWTKFKCRICTCTYRQLFWSGRLVPHNVTVYGEFFVVYIYLEIIGVVKVLTNTRFFSSSYEAICNGTIWLAKNKKQILIDLNQILLLIALFTNFFLAHHLALILIRFNNHDQCRCMQIKIEMFKTGRGLTKLWCI